MHTAFVALVVTACCFAGALKADPAAEITQLRNSEPDYVYFRGGIYDGAAGGQTTTVIITPGDLVRCVFEQYDMDEFDPEQVDIENLPTVATTHVLQAPGLFEDLQKLFQGSAILGPLPDELPENNFSVELSDNRQVSWLSLDWDIPEFKPFLDIIFRTQTPCWTFG